MSQFRSWMALFLSEGFSQFHFRVNIWETITHVRVLYQTFHIISRKTRINESGLKKNLFLNNRFILLNLYIEGNSRENNLDVENEEQFQN